MILDLNHRAERTALHELDLVRFVQVPVLLLEIGIDIPRVPLLRLVNKCLKQVAASGRFRTARIGLGGSQRFRAASLIEKAGHAACLRIDLDADELIFQRVNGGFQKRVNRRGAVCRMYEISLITERWRLRQQQKVSAVCVWIEG